ncbi:tyrosine-type recombinase/integrase [Rhizobium sp. RU36D]|uniref:tyrosine-type recombinase/integrase n=1 Tax=Rhizobium sp. RU36D TaxID=1907415 RepID=UPI0009D7BC6C|nr:tyrosine-type recombinase/integrase [Rhizobium sp. RU36D]SMC95946.1 Site-specific recombinase XerD [Rhizobium sp. RU36D]
MDMSFRPTGVTPIHLSDIRTGRSFREAADAYIKSGGEQRYLPPIIDYFGDRPLASIYPADIREMAEVIYPLAKGSTRNRQAVTPARAVLMWGYDKGWCGLIRVRRFKTDKPKRLKAASPLWMHDFTRQCDRDVLPHLAAIVMFMAQTGARISEAVALRWSEVDLNARTALLLKTKTSTNSVRYITDGLVGRLRDLRVDQSADDRVFRYTSRHSVNERIKAVCERAGIENKPPHTCGRRTFATRAIDLGMDVRTAMTAGGWESSSVFLEIYVQPRVNAGRMVADRFALDDVANA